MSQVILRRRVVTFARHRGLIDTTVARRSISLNSGIQQGLRAEGRDQRSSRGRRPSTSRSNLRSRFAQPREDLPERGPRFRDDVPERSSRTVGLRRGDTERHERLGRETSKSRYTSSRSGDRDDLDDRDPRFQSGKKPGKWERAAMAAGGSREEWRDVRAVRRPGKGPTRRFSSPDKIWNRFKEHDEFEGETYTRPVRASRDRRAARPEQDEQDYASAKSTSHSSFDSSPDSLHALTKQSRQRQATDNNRSSRQEPVHAQWNKNGGDQAPNRIPVSSATSELVFGRNAVLSVLRSKRRKLFKLYVHERVFPDTKGGEELYWELGRLATEAGVEVEHVGDDWLALFDRTAQGKAHNGCVLEASPVPTPLITSLDVSASDDVGPYYTVKLDRSDSPSVGRTRATSAKVRFPSNTLATEFTETNQYPLVIYCHNLTDTGNFGALLRSAYWFRVAGVAFPLRASAKPDNVTVKTSSGASEGVNLFTVRDTTAFLTQSRKAGWQIIAAMPPSSKVHFGNLRNRHSEYTVPDMAPRLAQLRRQGPVVLMLGGEEHGIPFSLAQVATGKVCIAGQGENELGVDSLNVSVAASLILAEFARPLSNADMSAMATQVVDDVAEPSSANAAAVVAGVETSEAEPVVKELQVDPDQEQTIQETRASASA